MRVEAVADAYLSSLADFDPQAASLLGRDSAPLPDLSPETFDARAELDRRTIVALEGADSDSPEGGALKEAMLERLSSDVALHDVGFTMSLVAPLATPVHGIIHRIEGAPTDSIEEWHDLNRLLLAVPASLAGYRATLDEARRRGHVRAERQLEVLSNQIAAWISDGAAGVVTGVRHKDVPTGLSGSIDEAVADAVDSFAAFGGWLRTSLIEHAPTTDGVGDETYTVTANAFLGEPVDLTEIAAWGRSQVEDLVIEATTLAHEIGSGDLDEVCRRLDETMIVPAGDVERWLSRRVRQSVERVFDQDWPMPPAAEELRCVVTPAASGVMYYSPASADGSRPATVWWTVDGDTVPAWRQVTTVHHEAVPGHHLQHVATVDAPLHPWQRHFCHVHGYAEGWAHHAERVADEFGLLESPAERLGMVLGQLHRAARIVADTSLHLDTRPDREVGWSAEDAVAYLEEVARLDPISARFEVDRYLGWPGQALAFRVGAKAWADIRASVEKRQGEEFHAGKFYADALAAGPMGLGPLRRLVQRDL